MELQEKIVRIKERRLELSAAAEELSISLLKGNASLQQAASLQSAVERLQESVQTFHCSLLSNVFKTKESHQMQFITLLLIVVSIFGCEGKSPTGTKAPEKQQQASLPVAPPSANAPTAEATRLSVTGTILEIIDVTDGMYLRLKSSQGETWAAVNKASVKKGAEVTIVNAIPMDGFESKKLKRKFDHIVFGSLATGSSPTAGTPQTMPAGKSAPTDKQAAAVPQHPAMAAPADMGNIQVKKAEGAEGKTVAEIIAGKASLKEAPISLRGKVVKYNEGIMGKNWLHLRDGSGSPEKKDNDITVTTTDAVKVGDVVLVKGKVSLDRDFGAGYTYPVIIEDAKVSK